MEVKSFKQVLETFPADYMVVEVLNSRKMFKADWLDKLLGFKHRFVSLAGSARDRSPEEIERLKNAICRMVERDQRLVVLIDSVHRVIYPSRCGGKKFQTMVGSVAGYRVQYLSKEFPFKKAVDLTVSV